MMTNFIETDPAVAKKIMGPDCVTVEEALSIFPCPKEYLEELGPVPYSTGTLYQCSEPKNRHILIPGFYRVGKHPLTIVNMRSFFPEHKALFAPWNGLVTSVVSGLKHSTCQPCWYLISKDVLSISELTKFCVRQDVAFQDLWAETAAVYIYSWLLMKRLRNESVFCGEPFFCNDDVSFERYKIALRCDENCVTIRPCIYQSEAMHRLSFVPTIEPELDVLENKKAP